MKRIVLLRHGESLWNRENRFTGWTDVDLSEQGIDEATQAGDLLRRENFCFDQAYTSVLKRAIHTLNRVLDRMDQSWIPVEKSWRLNEKHYGALQGLNKRETAQRYGEDRVMAWRRDFHTAPEALQRDDPRNPRMDPRYRLLPDAACPLTESLSDTVRRTLPYWECVIMPRLAQSEQLLVVAHGNSLRGIIKHLKQLSDTQIATFNLPTAVPYVFEFDSGLNCVNDFFLGDPGQIADLMKAVSDQGRVQ